MRAGAPELGTDETQHEEGQKQSARDAGRDQAHPRLHDEALHIGARRAQRHPNAHFTPSLGYGIGHDAVEADADEQNPEGGEHGKELKAEARFGILLAFECFLDGTDVAHDGSSIECESGAFRSFGEWCRIAGGADDQGEATEGSESVWEIRLRQNGPP